MTLEEARQRAIGIRKKYDDRQQAQGKPLWDGQARMAGFVGDVGELSQIIMAKHGLRPMDDVDEKLAHELADCLWSVLVLADTYGIDLGAAFLKTMDELDTRLAAK